MSATTLATSVLERFLRYVQIDTQSAEGSTTAPSTAKQLVLLDLLVEELKQLGLSDATRDTNGIVFATLPATSKKAKVPVFGLIAHVDTSPDVSGAGVKPIVHHQWDGKDLVLPDDPNSVLRRSALPALERQIGNDLVTASGTTLLGADDKAGVAEIMAAVEHLVKHPEIPHGTIRVAFTPDEEIGHGATHFDVPRFGAEFAYTLDGEEAGQIDLETFCGDTMAVTFHGKVTHPGFGKGRLVNAIKIAAEFVARLPKDCLSPETTEGREGYVHPVDMQADVDRTTVRFIIRAFDIGTLRELESFVEKLARDTAGGWPSATVGVAVTESYRNFKEVLDRRPEIVENAREAIRRAGFEPVDAVIRGGTDGSRLSFMGLPTPNLFTGGHNYHSRIEWVSVQDMEKAVETIVHLAQVWEERA
jgi:tripeptide aminopeptidase